MEFNRNQFFFLGMFCLLVGLQLRMVEAYVLTPEATKILAERTGTTQVASAAPSPDSFIADTAVQAGYRKTLRPPEWVGWPMLSIGAVLILHSLAMPKPS